MNIFDFSFDNWYTLVLKLNWLAVILIILPESVNLVSK